MREPRHTLLLQAVNFGCITAPWFFYWLAGEFIVSFNSIILISRYSRYWKGVTNWQIYEVEKALCKASKQEHGHWLSPREITLSPFTPESEPILTRLPCSPSCATLVDHPTRFSPDLSLSSHKLIPFYSTPDGINMYIQEERRLWLGMGGLACQRELAENALFFGSGKMTVYCETNSASFLNPKPIEEGKRANDNGTFPPKW